MDLWYRHGYAARAWTCIIDMEMQYGLAEWICKPCSIDIHAAWTWTCSIDKNLDKQHVFFHSAFPCPYCISAPTLHVHAACPSPYCFHVYAASPCPCCLSMSTPHVHVHAACSCSYYISMSVMHFHVCITGACPGLCCKFMSILHSMSILHVHVHAVCPCPCCSQCPCCSPCLFRPCPCYISCLCYMSNWPCPCCMSMSISMLHVHIHVYTSFPCPCCLSNCTFPRCPVVHVHASCLCPCCMCMSMLNVWTKMNVLLCLHFRKPCYKLFQFRCASYANSKEQFLISDNSAMPSLAGTYIDITSWDITSMGSKHPETKQTETNCTVDKTSGGQNVQRDETSSGTKHP